MDAQSAYLDHMHHAPAADNAFGRSALALSEHRALHSHLRAGGSLVSFILAREAIDAALSVPGGIR